MGWLPLRPDEWFSSDRTRTIDLNTADPDDIKQDVMRVFEQKAWEKAERHFLGEGLEKGGPCLEPARKTKSKLVRNGEHQFARALDRVVCASALLLRVAAVCCGICDD